MLTLIGQILDKEAIVDFNSLIGQILAKKLQ